MAEQNIARLFLVPRPSATQIQTPVPKDNSELVSKFMEYLFTERRLARNTVQSYALDLLQAARMLPCSLQTATRDDLRQMFARFQRNGIKATSLARKLSTLRHFYQYLRRKKLITTIPLQNIPLPKRLMRLPKPVSDPDFVKLVKACDSRTPEGLRDLAVLHVLDSCGLRGSELTHLTLDDLHLSEGHIIVRAGKGDKDRFAPIDKTGIDVLLAYLATSRPVLRRKRKADPSQIFPYTRQRIFQIIRAICKRANIAPLHPHQLRHRLGSSLVRAGLELREVADILGHTSTDTTEIYVGLDFSYLRKVFRETHPRIERP